MMMAEDGTNASRTVSNVTPSGSSTRTAVGTTECDDDNSKVDGYRHVNDDGLDGGDGIEVTVQSATNNTSNSTAQEVVDNNPSRSSIPQEAAVETAASGRKWKDTMIDLYWTNEFLILIIIAILLAKAYPPLGAEYLYPHITATWIAVIVIFLLAGLSLKTEELTKAFQRFWFNCFVEVYNFGFVSGVVYVVSTGLKQTNILSDDLAAGMIICACLPMTINMVMVLTVASGGDEASAIFNAAAGNMLGVFLSPMLILLYLNEQSDIDILEVFFELTIRVVIPVIVGQIIQKTSPTIMKFVQKDHKIFFKQLQQYTLVFIVYTVFCRTFENDTHSSISDVFLMIFFQFALLSSFMGFAWIVLKVLYPKKPKLRVMGLYGCTHKSVATGIPLIEAIYGNNAAVGLFTLPLLIWHPMQLIFGTMISPYLARFVLSEQKRLSLDENDRPIEETVTLAFDSASPEQASIPVSGVPTTTTNQNNNDNDDDDGRQDNNEDENVNINTEIGIPLIRDNTSQVDIGTNVAQVESTTRRKEGNDYTRIDSV